MKKSLITVLTFLFLLSLIGTSHAWEGRMGGMNDPYGLIEDESDFLTHPALLAEGTGTKFYGDYRFTHTDVYQWNYKLNDPLDGYFWHFNGSSEPNEDNTHNVAVGAAFPLCVGRLGVFFSYDAERAGFYGKENYIDDVELRNANYKTDHDLDNFNVNLLYAVPVKGWDLGVEFGASYQEAKQEQWLDFYRPWGTQTLHNPFDAFIDDTDVLKYVLSQFGFPYNASYWQLLGKGGLSKKLNNVTIDWTVRGGYILHADSDNTYNYSYSSYSTPNLDFVNMKGNVRGYNVGSDLWVRYKVEEGLDLPFLVSVNQAKTRYNGSGFGEGEDDFGGFYGYSNTQRSFDVKVGGGVERSVKDCGQIGAGLYYEYLQNHEWFSGTVDGYFHLDETEHPFMKEHRVVLALAGEKEFSSFSLRGGANLYYGWVVNDDYTLSGNGIGGMMKYSNDGRDWGIGASLGASKKIGGITLEPFLNGGVREFSTSGNLNYYPVSDALLKRSWYGGVGCSILFDM